MLYIEYIDRDTHELVKREWHIYEPLPTFNARVVKFQADGDELETLLDAMFKKSPSRGN